MIGAGPGIAWLAALTVKACLVLGLAALATRRLRDYTAGVRHAVWLAAFLGVVALPLVGAFPPAVELAWRPATAVTASDGNTANDRRLPDGAQATIRRWLRGGAAAPGPPAGEGNDAGRPVVAPDGAPERPAERRPALPRDGRRLFTRLLAPGGEVAGVAWLAPALVAAYATVALALLLRLALGVRGASRLGRRAQPVHPAGAGGGAHHAARPVALLASNEVRVPVTFGLRRPTIVVPPEWPSWPAPLRRNVMLHETAHVDRYDWPVQLFTRAVCAAYWFNPLVWLAARRLFVEAEQACDEHVLRSGSSPADYAAHLLLLARSHDNVSRAQVTMAIARPSDLLTRVKTIHRIHQGALPMSRRSRFAVTLSIFAIATLLGAIGLTAATPSHAPAGIQRQADQAEALIRASAAGDIDEVRRLLAAGADPSLPLPAAGTPLIRAASGGHLDVVEALLSAGADPNQVLARGDANRWSDRRPDLMRTALTEAARRGHLRVVQRLVDAGARVNALPPGDASALMEAAENGHEDIVRLLVGMGADVDRVVPGDGTPLIAAARGGNLEMLRLLVSSGADVNRPSPGDGNALIAAVRRGDREMVRFLLDAGADPRRSVPGDESALVQAAERGDDDLLRLLLGGGR